MIELPHSSPFFVFNTYFYFWTLDVSEKILDLKKFTFLLNIIFFMVLIVNG